MRGRQTDQETVDRIMSLWILNNNARLTAEEVGLPCTTVNDIINRNKNNPEIAKIRAEKMNQFADRAAEVIDIALIRLINDLQNNKKEIPTNHLTTVIGTMFDKRALALGESTDNTKITFELPPGVDEYAE